MPPFHHADTAMKAKTVILAMPPIFGIHQVIAENLRFHGFEVTELIYEEGKLTYANIWQRLKKLFYRNLFAPNANTKKSSLFPAPILPISPPNSTKSKDRPTTAL